MRELTIKGIYRDRLLDAEGRLIFDSGWKSNLIVNNCHTLIAGLMRNEPNTQGIQTLQIGRGKAEWDTAPPPVPDPSAGKLVDPSPFTVKLGTSLKLEYLNDNDTPAPSPTNRIQVVATLGPGVPPAAIADPYPLREFALFGNLATRPCMIDYILHPKIEKQSTATLERRVRLIF